MVYLFKSLNVIDRPSAKTKRVILYVVTAHRLINLYGTLKGDVVGITPDKL
jgi:hypothetical protein